MQQAILNPRAIRRCLFSLGLALLCIPGPAHAQQDDFGVWASVAVRHKFTQRLSATVEEQVRFNQNAAAVAQYFTDAGLEYSITKKFKIGLSYRFINDFQATYFSKRHRLYADLTYKTKFSKFQFLVRARLQEQQKDIRSSETGYLPEWVNRNKLTVKLDLGKKYVPYISAEMYYLISAPNSEAGYIDKMRYTAGAEYEFNRVHAIDLFYLVQHDIQVNDPVTDFVVGVGYVYSF